MPNRKTVESFVSLVEERKYDRAIELYYSENASMQENLELPRIGRAGLVEGERRVMSSFQAITAAHVGPVLIDGDHVVVRWVFEFTGKNGGKRRLDELAYQRWTGEQIAEERFYYDPGQMKGSAAPVLAR